MKIRAKITEIVFLSLLVQEVGFDCFTNYSAHINEFSVQLYNGKWSSKDEAIQTKFNVSDNKRSLTKADSVIWHLKSILKKKHINYEELIQVERIEIDYVF